MTKNWGDTSYDVTGYTELSVPSLGGSTIYKCKEYDQWLSRYDFALVADPISEFTYIAMIVGIFKYKTPGFPTPQHENIPLANIKERNLRDDFTYIAVSGSTDYFTEQELSKKMITHFKLLSDDQVYILPITSIKQPLIVVRNFGADDSVSYLHCLPSSKWPQLFTNLIKNLMTKHNEIWTMMRMRWKFK